MRKYKKEKEFKKYKRQGFDENQLYEIEYGIKYNLDVTKYADLKFDYIQMENIRIGLELGLDVSKYVNPEYNEYQMKEIQEGLRKGLDVDKYANPKFDKIEMAKIRKQLERTKIGEPENECRNKKIEEKFLKYKKLGFDKNQLYEIYLGLEENVDVARYANLKFKDYDMREIRLGLLSNDYGFVRDYEYFLYKKLDKEQKTKKEKQKEPEMEI